jgi:hypothetical protein
MYELVLYYRLDGATVQMFWRVLLYNLWQLVITHNTILKPPLHVKPETILMNK